MTSELLQRWAAIAEQENLLAASKALAGKRLDAHEVAGAAVKLGLPLSAFSFGLFSWKLRRRYREAAQ